MIADMVKKEFKLSDAANREVLTYEECACLLRISVDKLRDLFEIEDFKVKKIGHRTVRVPKKAFVERFLR